MDSNYPLVPRCYDEAVPMVDKVERFTKFINQLKYS
jgi:hypothetical protein